DRVRRAQTPDVNVSRNPSRPRIQEGALRTPDLEPAPRDRIVVVIVRLGSPADCASGCPFEHLLRNLAVVGEPPIEIRGEAVAQEGEDTTRVESKDGAQGRGIPEREAGANTPTTPPADHGSPSRRTNPTPRTVWMSFVGAS